MRRGAPSSGGCQGGSPDCWDFWKVLLGAAWCRAAGQLRGDGGAGRPGGAGPQRPFPTAAARQKGEALASAEGRKLAPGPERAESAPSARARQPPAPSSNHRLEATGTSQGQGPSISVQPAPAARPVLRSSTGGHALVQSWAAPALPLSRVGLCPSPSALRQAAPTAGGGAPGKTPGSHCP